MLRFLLPCLFPSCFDDRAAGAAELSSDIAECLAGASREFQGGLGWRQLLYRFLVHNHRQIFFLYIATDMDAQRNHYSADRNCKIAGTVGTIVTAAWYLIIT